MTLREERVAFTHALAQLIVWAGESGIEVALGPDGLKHKVGSLHFSGLAVDLNAYRDGVYLTSCEDYRKLGDHWKTLHELARWGGDFKNESSGDGNHFSFEFQGRK
jgi:hypothetical protein